jgi:hypothetical protein
VLGEALKAQMMNNKWKTLNVWHKKDEISYESEGLKVEGRAIG